MLTKFFKSAWTVFVFTERARSLRSKRFQSNYCAKVRAGDPIRFSVNLRSGVFFFFFQGISAAWKKCGTGLEIIFLCPVGLACLVWLAKWTTDTWCCRFLYMKWFTIPWKFFNSLDEIPHLIITFEIPFLPDWRYQTTLLFERAGQVFWYQWCGRNKTTRHKCNTFCTICQKAVFKK